MKTIIYKHKTMEVNKCLNKAIWDKEKNLQKYHSFHFVENLLLSLESALKCGLWTQREMLREETHSSISKPLSLRHSFLVRHGRFYLIAPFSTGAHLAWNCSGTVHTVTVPTSSYVHQSYWIWKTWFTRCPAYSLAIKIFPPSLLPISLNPEGMGSMKTNHLGLSIPRPLHFAHCLLVGLCITIHLLQENASLMVAEQNNNW